MYVRGRVPQLRSQLDEFKLEGEKYDRVLGCQQKIIGQGCLGRIDLNYVNHVE
jgi:hypothetical protein